MAASHEGKTEDTDLGEESWDDEEVHDDLAIKASNGLHSLG